jgi:hypothetical protein
MTSAELMARYGTMLSLFGDGTVTGSPLRPDDATAQAIAAAMKERAKATVH